MLPGFLFRLSFLAEDDFALAHQLIIEPEPVFIGGGLQARARWAAQKAHAGRSLENVGGKGATVDVEFNAKIACIGDPRNLIPWIEYDGLGYQSNKYGALCHFSSATLVRVISPHG